mgnify:CR=1 FL=1
MKKLGMGALIALAIAGVSVASLGGGCEKKKAEPAKTPAPADKKPADGGH